MDEKDEETLSWSEFQSQRFKKLFGTDSFENKDVLDYMVAALSRNKRPVRIVQDPVASIYDEYIVAHFDPEENYYLAIFLAKTREECEKFVNDNKLILEESKELI